MRSSPLPQHRLPRSTDVEQYALPYPAEAEVSISESEADHVVNPRSRRPGRQIPTPEDSGTQKLYETKRTRRNGKRKPPAKVNVPPHAKLLVSREEAAEVLSISIRSVDYLIARRQLTTRRIGTRALIPMSQLQKFARMDHPERVAIGGSS